MTEKAMEQSTKLFPGIIKAADILGVGRSWLRNEVASGRVPCFRIGNQIHIDLSSYQKMLSQQAMEAVKRD